MKRILIIALFFCITSLVILTSCTVYCSDGNTCRGPGYECGVCACQALSCACSDFDSSEYEVYNAAVEGTDYTKPQIKWVEDTATKKGHLTVSMEVLCGNIYVYDFEILIIQDGIILDTIKVFGHTYGIATSVRQGEYTKEYDVNLKNKKDDGGEVYYLVNSFVVNKKT